MNLPDHTMTIRGRVKSQLDYYGQQVMRVAANLTAFFDSSAVVLYGTAPMYALFLKETGRQIFAQMGFRS